ncbi:MAG TPA: Phasin (PHA-granule associated protein) [Oxalobacteraceae bacterium]|nr:Phasin (PHA-granule associated protein) [Oxalobacteraceae bacterium]HCN90800.1 Phasin (PHA-granule associated protein) [Oxalobacteraceae bacterium]
MFAVPEQFSAATKTNFDAFFTTYTDMTNKAFEGVSKVVDLHLNLARTSLEDSAVAAKQLLAAKDPQEFFAVSAAQAQPSTDKALAYGRQLASIASSTQAELSKAAEAQIAETNRKVIALVDEVSKNAPAGSENVIAFVKSSIGNANAGYEQLTKTTKQAVEAMEVNVASTVNEMTKTAEKAVSRAKK